MFEMKWSSSHADTTMPSWVIHSASNSLAQLTREADINKARCTGDDSLYSSPPMVMFRGAGTANFEADAQLRHAVLLEELRGVAAAAVATDSADASGEKEETRGESNEPETSMLSAKFMLL
jgi:hypothetical protein